MKKLMSTFIRSRVAYAAMGLLLFLAASRSAQAENRDIVQFGNQIVVHDGEEAHDLVCILCSIEVDGTVHGDMVAILGNIRVRGRSERDAVAILGNISLAENAGIERDVVVIAGSLYKAPGATIGNDRVVLPQFILLLPFLFLALFVVLIIWAIRALVSRPRVVYPIPPPRY